jgi:hypothetical protein
MRIVAFSVECNRLYISVKYSKTAAILCVKVNRQRVGAADSRPTMNLATSAAVVSKT